MSNRPDITKKLSLSLEKHLNPKNDTRIYIAKECTFDYATEKHFCGTDWYFFYNECDDYEDRYWVETLTVKKQEWEEYCKQFEE